VGAPEHRVRNRWRTIARQLDGSAAMADGWRDLAGGREYWDSEAEEYRELGDERVLVLGRVTRIVNHCDRDSAFADLGLEK
jgi:hypothetical protein